MRQAQARFDLAKNRYAGFALRFLQSRLALYQSGSEVGVRCDTEIRLSQRTFARSLRLGKSRSKTLSDAS